MIDDGTLVDFVVNLLFGMLLLGALALVVRSLFSRRVCTACQRLNVSFVLGPITAQEVDEMTLRLTDEQQVKVAVTPLTAHGHEAALDGAPSWTSSNPAVATVIPSDDRPTEALVVAQGLGSAQILVSADADLSEGVRTLSGVIDIEVVAAEAISLGVVAGTPEDQLPAGARVIPEPAPAPGA